MTEQQQAFSAGERLGEPLGDPSRQAIASLRGYAYQLYVSALAWLALRDGELLYLEVAEDYAVCAGDALAGVQVKDTAGSGSLTIRSEGARKAIDAFVDLVLRNPERQVRLRYLTTSPIAPEKSEKDRIGSEPALLYWRRAAAGAPVEPLRDLLLRLPLSDETLAFIRARDAASLRRDLLERMHWDAGQAPITDLRMELEAGVVELASSALGVSPSDAAPLSGTILGHVLDTAISTDSRRLRRADLLGLLARATMISVPRAQFLRLLGLGPGAAGAPRLSVLTPGLAKTSPGLFLAPRQDLIRIIAEELDKAPAACLWGASGMGKTHIASEVARARGGSWSMLDLRALSPEAAASRLLAALGEVVVHRPATLVLDDLDQLDDPRTRRAVRQVVAALERGRGKAVITCACAPTAAAWAEIAGADSQAIGISYLDVEELSVLLKQAGGDARHAAAVHLATSGGHPQLVQAALLHLRAENWSTKSVEALVGGSSEAIEAERSSARRRIVAAMPAPAQAMLFRTSLIVGQFGRTLALALGDVDPRVPMPGAELDRLVGPWIEILTRSALRVSPLVANAGTETLSPSEQQRVHQAIVDHMMGERIEVVQGDAILHHALEGGRADQVFGFANAIIVAPDWVREDLASWAPGLGSLSTDQAPYPSHPLASGLLRLGQLLVLLAGRRPRASDAYQALRRETSDFSDPPGIEEAILSKVMNEPATSALIPDWLDLLLRLDELSEQSERLRLAFAELERSDGSTGSPIGVLFGVQGLGLSTVGGLREVVERLDRTEAPVRTRMLSMLRAAPGDFSHLMNAPWIKAAAQGNIDGEAAAADYEAISRVAEGWGEHRLAGRAAVTAAVMLDEYGSDRARALKALRDAEDRLGRDAIFSRARAKIHWRSRDHSAALSDYASVIHGLGDDPVEQAFVAREAAIVSAELGRWTEAGDYFGLARDASASVAGPEFQAMTVGLVGDAAQAAYMAGDGEAAVRMFATALEELRTLDPDVTLKAAYCHRVVRHAVLWLLEQASGEELMEGGAVLPPGACSNPDPQEGIRALPLGHIDIAWYLLAEAERAVDVRVVSPTLRERLEAGPVLAMEVSRVRHDAQEALLEGDVRATVNILPLIAGLPKAMQDAGDQAGPALVTNPVRGEVEPTALDAMASEEAVSRTTDFAIAFSLLAAARRQPENIAQLRKLGATYVALEPVLAALDGEFDRAPAPWHGRIARAVRAIASGTLEPEGLWAATAHVAMFLERGGFASLIGEEIAEWAAKAWREVVERRRFALRSPRSTAPAILEAAQAARDPLRTLAGIVLAAAPAVGGEMDKGTRSFFRGLHERAAADDDLPPTVGRHQPK